MIYCWWCTERGTRRTGPSALIWNNELGSSTARRLNQGARGGNFLYVATLGLSTSRVCLTENRAGGESWPVWKKESIKALIVAASQLGKTRRCGQAGQLTETTDLDYLLLRFFLFSSSFRSFLLTTSRGQRHVFFVFKRCVYILKKKKGEKQPLCVA